MASKIASQSEAPCALLKGHRYKVPPGSCFDNERFLPSLSFSRLVKEIQSDIDTSGSTKLSSHASTAPKSCWPFSLETRQTCYAHIIENVEVKNQFLENQLLLISINFTPKTSHSCLKKWYTRFSRLFLVCHSHLSSVFCQFLSPLCSYVPR